MESRDDRGLMALTTEQPPVSAIDAGVIEDARRRQRRRWTGGSAVAAGVAGVAALVVFATGGGHSNGKGNSGPDGQPVRLTFSHGYVYVNRQPVEVAITPSLNAGTVAMNVHLAGIEPGESEGESNSSYPTTADPLFGGDYTSNSYAPFAGRVELALVGPTVAEMRVKGLGTFKPHKVVGLLPGQRAIAFYRPTGASGTLVGPGGRAIFTRDRRPPALTETLYNAAGKPIPISFQAGTLADTFHAAHSEWIAPAKAPANARCATTSTLSGASLVAGDVATAIAPDRQLSGPAFFSCLNSVYHWHGAGFQVGILLNAEAPGATPAPLWNANPVPGHPGIFEIKAVRYALHYRAQRAPFSPPHGPRFAASLRKHLGKARAEKELQALARNAQARNKDSGREITTWTTLSQPTIARRVGNAWLIVRGAAAAIEARFSGRGGPSAGLRTALLLGQAGPSNAQNPLQENIQFLDGLRITRLKLPG